MDILLLKLEGQKRIEARVRSTQRTGYYKMDGGKSKNLTEEEIPNFIKKDVENGWPWGGHASYGCKCPGYASFICLGPISSEISGN